MNTFDYVVLNLVHVLFPILVYVFYMAYRKVDDERENELAVIILIFSILYIILRYNIPIVDNIPMILINIPLIFAYLKRNNLAALITSIVIITYIYKFYNQYFLIILIEYAIYYIVYLFTKTKPTNKYFIPIFVIIKMIFMLIILILTNNATINDFTNALLLDIIFYIVITSLLFIMNKLEQILKMHKSFKETLQHKQIRTSLFQITHEIKNPIAVCKGYLDMFDVNNPEHAQKYIPIIKEEISKTLLLLEDFLSMNQLKLNKDLLDINLLLNEVLDNYSLYLLERKIKIINNIADNEIYINGDYNRLTQVFVNIIKNSIEAIENNGIIEISNKIKNKKIHIFIKDNGQGIPKEVLEKIKEPFFTTKKKGNGLGTSLSNEIIEAHEGTLEYKSEEGKYTLVTITLPITEI